MSFPRYERYKNAGIGWLSEVPAHWQIIPNKALLRATNDLVGTNSSDFTLLSLTLFGVIVRDIESGKGKFPAEFDSYKAVEANDLIFCLFDLDETPRTIGLANQAGMITGAYEVLRCRALALPNYICYFYLHVDGFKGLRPWYTGLRKVVRPDTFMSIKVALPPLDEQVAISSLLNIETTKIDGLIEEQRRLIELLKEKRQAVISHAVTKGLNSHVPMKDSGLEWLGDIPAHWEIYKFSWAFKASKGRNGQMLTKEYCGQHEGEYPVFSGQTVDGGVMGRIDEFEFDFPNPGVLFSTTVGAKAMDLKQISGRFSLSQNCMIMWPIAQGQELVLRFFYYHCQPLFLYERDMIPDHMQASFRMEDLYGYRIAIPPLTEQQLIASYLDDQTLMFDSLIIEAEKQVSLLHERRSALISAAVTGKIDVRKYPLKEAV